MLKPILSEVTHSKAGKRFPSVCHEPDLMRMNGLEAEPCKYRRCNVEDAGSYVLGGV